VVCVFKKKKKTGSTFQVPSPSHAYEMRNMKARTNVHGYEMCSSVLRPKKKVNYVVLELYTVL